MTDTGGGILWQPDEARVAASRLTEFRRHVRRNCGAEVQTQAELFDWSLARPEEFWREMWRFGGVIGEGSLDTVVVDGELMPGARWFPDVRLNYAENLLSTAVPDVTEALVFRGETDQTIRWSWGRLRAAAATVAAALRADGIGPGDRVAGFLPNLPETVVAMLGAASVGAVWSSCSPDFGVEGVVDRFGQTGPRVLFAADGYRYGGREIDSLGTAWRLLAELPSVERLVVIPFLGRGAELPAGACLWEDYLAPHQGARPAYTRLPFDHPLFIMFSSGTTGLPKCMVHGAGGTLLQHLKEHQLHCDLGAGDRLFYFTTCGWMMWNWLVSGLASGATLMLYDGHPLQPATAIWDYAEQERFGILGASARWLAACQKLNLRPRETHDLSGLRVVLSTGSPLSPESFDYVYRDVQPDVQLSSISGGTDIISCFALGSPVLPVRRGELQCRGLGMAVSVWDESGRAVQGEKGELVCTQPFPSMPTGFWNDPDGVRYHAAYFGKYPGVWCHGDFAELTPTGGMIIHGRSDAVLNPGGVRIGTAEIYRVVEQFAEVEESLVVGWQRDGDVVVTLFVKLADGQSLDHDLVLALRQRIRQEKTPRHVPGIVRQVPEIPRTISGKIVELAVRNILHGRAVDNADALANPEALAAFRQIAAELS